ncbi:hypothetical protein OA238_c38610 [Octadecabacter arcticus 238]|uniref:Uncharacterized protein n=1 Tax=Octadecabacter arcticus 238 TaxID=391616 RepID=M9RTH5_9RHOB|nr:hypothetical protein [Octadecabacter arcticus]AGI73806.1 hypothetical protein OA238_c38610 [Octadecabacter arcticus 238]
MLRLDILSQPRWLDLGHGVRLFVEPLTTAVMLAARSDPSILAATADVKVIDAWTAADDDVTQSETGPSNDDLARIVAKAVARIVVHDWEGVGDAEGKPLSVTPDGIDALLEIWPIFEAFQTRYIAGAFILDAEKNV